MRACQSPEPVANTLPAGLRSIEMTGREDCQWEWEGSDRLGITDLSSCDPATSTGRSQTWHPRTELRGLSIRSPPIARHVRQQRTRHSPVPGHQAHPKPASRIRTLWPVKFIVHALLPSRLPTSFFPFNGSRFGPPGEFGRPPGPFASRETSQYLSVLSKLPLTSPRASGVNATLYTLSLCPRSLSNNSPVRASQIRTTCRTCIRNTDQRMIGNHVPYQGFQRLQVVHRY